MYWVKCPWELFKPHGYALKLGYYFLFYRSLDNLHKVTKIIRGTTKHSNPGSQSAFRAQSPLNLMQVHYSHALSFRESMKFGNDSLIASKIYQCALVENIQSVILRFVKYFWKFVLSEIFNYKTRGAFSG